MKPRILDLDRFVAAFERSRPREEDELLLAVNGWGVEGHDRIGLLALEERPRLIEDAYLPTRDIDALLQRLSGARLARPARRGGWHTMHATAWTHAWSDDAGRFVAVDPAGRVAWAEGEQLRLRDGAPVPLAELAAIEPYVAEDWVRRGVRVRLRDGATRDVAHEDDPMLDPFYDGLNLMADTFWTHALARALHHGLGAPIIDCT